MAYLELAETNDGLIVRICGDNHEPVFTTSNQLYTDERDALNAIAVAAEAFGILMDRPPPVEDGLVGSGVLDVDGRYFHVHRVDERTAAGR